MPALFDREAVLRGDFVAPADLLEADARLAPVDEAFARAPVLFFAAVLRAVDLLAVDLRAVDLRAVDLRALVLRVVDLRAADLPPPAEALPPPPSSPVHLPDITRCAASATASAMSVPSFAALEATLLAACCAVSAASRPASRIALRALGLALIAAAAAAKPAASISLLIAALAILSTVLPDLDADPERDRDDVDLDELFFAALAMMISSVG